VDSIQWGYEKRVQKQLVGHRLVAHTVFIGMFEDRPSITDFFPLPLLDGVGTSGPAAAEAQASFLERLAARGLTPIQS
jgi:hypothetical protein